MRQTPHVRSFYIRLILVNSEIVVKSNDSTVPVAEVCTALKHVPERREIRVFLLLPWGLMNHRTTRENNL